MNQVHIHINCDMGESYGRYTIADDESIMKYIDACNIACGFHAGDPVVMDKTIRLAKQHKVEIGAHPSYPDLQGFGRRPMSVPVDELEKMVRYQIAALMGMSKSLGAEVKHVKAHGALYNKASEDRPTAEAIAKAVKSLSKDLILYAPYLSIQSEVAEEHGLKVHHEAFIDRAYNEDRSLVSRQQPNSVITSPIDAWTQVESISKRGFVPTILKKEVPLKANTFCIHGDNSAAIEILEYIRSEQVQ